MLDRNVIDKVMPVWEEDAYKLAKDMAKLEGLLIGISGGAALYAAVELAKQEKNAGKTIVAILPDSGERYLSTKLFS